MRAYFLAGAALSAGVFAIAGLGHAATVVMQTDATTYTVTKTYNAAPNTDWTDANGYPTAGGNTAIPKGDHMEINDYRAPANDPANELYYEAFNQIFDFGGLTGGNAIQKFKFELNFSEAKNQVFDEGYEDWVVYVDTDGTWSSATRWTMMSLENDGPMETAWLTHDAVLGRINALNTFSFFFGENVEGYGSVFNLTSARLTMSTVGLAPVPLPAAGLLLLGGLGGLAAIRRRKAAVA